MSAPSSAEWSSDRRLDVLVLGPMGDKNGKASTLVIKKAVDALLKEAKFQALLDSHSMLEKKVHVPEGQNESEIVHNILGLLDTSDLVIIDLTPKAENPDRANVFYELALVQALGIPVMLLVKEGVSVPFYASTSNQYHVADFTLPVLKKALRAPLREFLDRENRTASFTQDRVTQFYGMSIVDISAAVGLATGYYDNFISRLITESGFLSHHPDVIKQVIYVRPSSLSSTYKSDVEALVKALRKKGFTLEKGKKLEPAPTDDKGPLWFDHVDGIVLDIPRMAYPLRRSPRLLKFHDRNMTFQSPATERAFHQRLDQIEMNLLTRMEAAIRFQVRHERVPIREKILHFTTIQGAPELVSELSESAGGS